MFNFTSVNSADLANKSKDYYACHRTEMLDFISTFSQFACVAKKNQK